VVGKHWSSLRFRAVKIRHILVFGVPNRLTCKNNHGMFLTFPLFSLVSNERPK
jgi:hypothetical protein